MSVYEVLERFVGAGVLSCAGLVGAEMPAGTPLDGAALAARLKGQRLNETFGATLDVLGHAVWFARERHGIPHDTAERHAAALAGLLTQVRLPAADLAAARTGAGIAALWLERAAAVDALAAAGLDPEICRFLLGEMLALVVDQPLLKSLKPVLDEHRQDLLLGAARAPTTPSELSAVGAAKHPPTATQEADPARLTLVVDRSQPTPPSAPPSAVQLAPVPAPAAAAGMLARHRLPAGALRRFQALLAQQPMSAEQRLARLDELSTWLLATVAHLRKQTNEPAALRQAKAEAATALENGELELAMERLKLVREHMREGRRRAEQRIAEELQALRQQMTEEAAATCRLGELAMARMDLGVAADHFADAAGQLPAGESALELEYRQRQADALAARAESTGDIRAIEAAAQAFRSCRRLLLADTDQRTRVRVGVGLGDMLVALATARPSEATELEEAVAAYAEAVAAIDRAVKPMQWALVQLSHGAALIELGQRRDRDRSWRLAAAALMPALEVFESRNAMDLAEAARAKLRAIATAIGDPAMLMPTTPSVPTVQAG
jgi:hypothetical protein